MVCEITLGPQSNRITQANKKLLFFPMASESFSQCTMAETIHLLIVVTRRMDTIDQRTILTWLNQIRDVF